MSREPDDEYKVGKNRPPLETRFQKGRSGNLNGRPKKQSPDVVEDLNRRLQEKITVNIHGKPKRMTKAALANEALITKAMKGDMHAYKILMKHIEKNATVDPDSLRREWDEKRAIEGIQAGKEVRAKIDLMAQRLKENKDCDPGETLE